ncbi:hypothetical protein ACFORH_35960 [Amycolatopsis roodepoortensis]|uniref:Uncharacterized protein involved in tellurium resistance n=1 Tax=Amycolatopsis roodepoortensis TaxID=700274 RepID=A0ABR9LHT7_9PSEU|nr:hypothetical protein [Amycolatopsis roodepoortensis]MBE1579837.1 uncharacterized protein involved in tellurium resistance [Amycolatopsis roodepoortensis]
MGCWHAIGKRGEIFTLYEQGFVHTKAFGGDFGCLVELTDGRKILINGFTEGAALLARNIFEAVGRRPG